jgi:hypothetical protein
MNQFINKQEALKEIEKKYQQFNCPPSEHKNHQDFAFKLVTCLAQMHEGDLLKAFYEHTWCINGLMAIYLDLLKGWGIFDIQRMKKNRTVLLLQITTYKESMKIILEQEKRLPASYSTSINSELSAGLKDVAALYKVAIGELNQQIEELPFTQRKGRPQQVVDLILNQLKDAEIISTKAIKNDSIQNRIVKLYLDTFDCLDAFDISNFNRITYMHNRGFESSDHE